MYKKYIIFFFFFNVIHIIKHEDMNELGKKKKKRIIKNFKIT